MWFDYLLDCCDSELTILRISDAVAVVRAELSAHVCTELSGDVKVRYGCCCVSRGTEQVGPSVLRKVWE